MAPPAELLALQPLVVARDTRWAGTPRADRSLPRSDRGRVTNTRSDGFFVRRCACGRYRARLAPAVYRREGSAARAQLGARGSRAVDPFATRATRAIWLSRFATLVETKQATEFTERVERVTLEPPRPVALELPRDPAASPGVGNGGSVSPRRVCEPLSRLRALRSKLTPQAPQTTACGACGVR